MKRPTAISKDMPVWVPANAAEERGSFVGALELVINEYEPLGDGRRLLALGALAMLVICFTPFPINL